MKIKLKKKRSKLRFPGDGRKATCFTLTGDHEREHEMHKTCHEEQRQNLYIVSIVTVDDDVLKM